MVLPTEADEVINISPDEIQIKSKMKSFVAAGKSISENKDEYYSNILGKQYDKHKVLANLQKLLVFCRWADIGGGGNSSSTESQS